MVGRKRVGGTEFQEKLTKFGVMVNGNFSILRIGGTRDEGRGSRSESTEAQRDGGVVGK
jgi:hypothetical protein